MTQSDLAKNSTDRSIVVRLGSHWKGMVLAMVLGGAFGWGISTWVLPPTYEAAARIAFSVDYGRTLRLDHIVEERVLDRIYQLLLSDATLEDTAAILSQELGPGTEWNSVAFLRRNLRLEQRLSRWDLIAIDTDPQRASEIANAWATVSMRRLEEAQEHAWRAAQMQGLRFVITCLALESPGTSREDLWECVGAGPELDPAQVDSLRSEIEAGHGVLPALSFELVQEAAPPEDPVLWDRGLLVVAGALVAGLLAAGIGLLRLNGTEGN